MLVSKKCRIYKMCISNSGVAILDQVTIAFKKEVKVPKKNNFIVVLRILGQLYGRKQSVFNKKSFRIL